MAALDSAPFQAQEPQKIKELVMSLEAHCKKGKGRGRGGFSVKKTTFTVPNKRTVDSWKMQDWDYKKPNLPTYARGLFTYTNQKGKDEIAVRGYDKFFNHGEVHATEWRNVEKNTLGPYELSVKENGCIVFMAGLDDGTLLVCSKHSTGARQDVDLSHASAGERWVERHLASVGKTKDDFARRLREMNATAVAELCDDAFEEHVLAYNPEASGLYLHGINLNLPEFATYPAHLVERFAADWGFKKTMHIVEDDIWKVKEFLDKTAETGAYAGRETEGFVIRCRARDAEGAPYHDWFFKYKFEEPYLMYRQWRECTKAMIAGKPPRYKKHKKITEEYLLFARRCLAKNPKLAKEYNQNHGIIKLRDEFLADRGLKGSDIIRQELERGDEVDVRNVDRNVVLVPIATIGCGKTTVAVALAKLFEWGHIQNDNVQARKNRGLQFASMIGNSLLIHPVCIADRNNHQFREREQLIRDVSAANANARFVALHWVHERRNYDQIRHAMRERVLARGDNHQTIQAASQGEKQVLEIMEGFLHRFQPADPSSEPDDAFDLIIDLDVTSHSRENLETVVAQLHSQYPKLFPGPMPTAADLDAAIDAAMNDYAPDHKHDVGRNINTKADRRQSKQQQQKQKRNGNAASDGTLLDPTVPPQVEFFAVRLPSARITGVLDTVFNDQPPAVARFYRQLQSQRRVQPQFHVTLIHRSASRERADMWDRLSGLLAPRYANAVRELRERVEREGRQGSISRGELPEPEFGTCSVRLERVVWDGRVMCFVVRLEQKSGDAGAEPMEIEGAAKDATVFETVNPIAHVTVGTANKDIKPKESNDLLQRWLREGSGGESGVQELMIPGQQVLEGSVRGVLSRF